MKGITINKEEFDSFSPDEKLEFEKLVRTALASETLKVGSNEHQRLLERVKWLSEESQREIGNATKQRNRKVITEAFKKHVKEHGVMPTILELVDRTGLSHTTVYNHQKSILTGAAIDEQVGRFANLREEFLNQIGSAGLGGDLKAAKMALDMLLKYRPEPQVVLSNEKSNEALRKLRALIHADRQYEADEILTEICYSSDSDINSDVKLKTA